MNLIIAAFRGAFEEGRMGREGFVLCRGCCCEWGRFVLSAGIFRRGAQLFGVKDDKRIMEM